MNKIDLIDKYFSNSLSPKEKLKFNELLENDEQFKKEFDFQKDLQQVISRERRKDLKEVLQDVADYMVRYPNAELQMEAVTRTPYCTTYFIGTQFVFTRKVLVGAIEQWQIDEAMKKYVKKQLFLGDYDALECRVMDLFKQGKIDWNDVKQMHKGTCSL